MIICSDNHSAIQKGVSFLATGLRKQTTGMACSEIQRVSTLSSAHTGKVTDEWFSHMSLKYQNERMELKGRIADLDAKLKKLHTAEKNNDFFIKAVRRFMDMDTLTAPLLKELISRIDVSEVQGKGKNRIQRIAIHYRFVGYLEMEQDYFEKNIKQDTRQGVAVEYVPQAASK